MRKISFICCSVFILNSFSLQAQLQADSATLAQSGESKALSHYILSLGLNASIYSGSENADPRFPINSGHPFWGTGEPVSSDVLYDGILYRGIPMWYDIVKNEVAVQHPTMNARVALNNNKITYFLLGDAPFLMPDRNLEGSQNMPDNFYRLLHDGKTPLFGRYTKRMFEAIQEGQYVTNYSKETSEYFIQKDGKYHPVKNLAGMLNLLSDKKQELQQHLKEFDNYLKSNHIRIKETMEQSMVRAIAHYDKISL